VVTEGAVVEHYRAATGRLNRRRIGDGQAVVFGPGHVHNVGHAGEDPAVSIHAYSPPLVAMTYYASTDHGLMASHTVAVDGPEGGRGSADSAITRVKAMTAGPVSGSVPAGAAGVDALLAEARGGLHRLRPEAAHAALTGGAVLVDIRPLEQRIAEGEVPGAIIIARNVLEWRLDPRCEARIPVLTRPGLKIIVMCSQGYASSLAAASLRRIGLEATDLDGGFQAWQATGLPTRSAHSLG
jgi:rhodanese-related sulfurtransferase